MMCQKARESTKQPWVFAYLTALGEHIARSNNISTLSFLYMRGLGDSPVQTAFGSEKTNQEGQQAGFYRSFFQNSRLPGGTFVFALACHMILSNVTLGQSPQQLVFGDSKATDKNFEEWFRKTLDGLDEADRSLLACAVADLGTHSVRKYAFTFAENAIDGPPQPAVEIRGNHKQDGQKET
jgi:hypothetical protein